MQFICESCKANLQIADEKIRGKRLIVRCKRCGVQIRIVDPALAPSQSGARPPSGPVRASAASGASSQSGSRPATGPIRAAAQSAPRPVTGPIARAPARAPETDNESTRSMDTEVLEKALRASKADDAPAAPKAPARSVPPPPPPPREVTPPRDPAVWFVMIQGKQA